jgi:hypothetical protein
MTDINAPTADVTTSVHDDGMVLLDTSNGRVFSTNATGAQLYRALGLGLPADVIAEGLSREYGLERRAADEHVTRFMTELARYGLLKQGAQS